MSEKILCPWCGAEMWFPKRAWELSKFPPTGEDVDGNSKWWARGKCLFCSALSPIVYGETEEAAMEWAKAAAIRRYTPLLKPLSKLEAVKNQFVYREWKGYDVDKEPILLGYIWDEWDESDRLTWQEFSEGAFEFVDESAYGKEWRCWERKPTDEERRAAEWEA